MNKPKPTESVDKNNKQTVFPSRKNLTLSKTRLSFFKRNYKLKNNKIDQWKFIVHNEIYKQFIVAYLPSLLWYPCASSQLFFAQVAFWEVGVVAVFVKVPLTP